MSGNSSFRSKLITPKEYICPIKRAENGPNIGEARVDLEAARGKMPAYVLAHFKKLEELHDLEYNRRFLEDVDIVLNNFLDENKGKINVWKLLFAQSTSSDDQISRSLLVLYQTDEDLKA